MRRNRLCVPSLINRRGFLLGATAVGSAFLLPRLTGPARAHIAGTSGCSSAGQDLLTLSPANGNIQEMSYSDGTYIRAYVIFSLNDNTNDYRFSNFDDGEIVVCNLGTTPVYLAATLDDVHHTNPSDHTPYSRPIESIYGRPQGSTQVGPMMNSTIVYNSNTHNSDGPVLYVPNGGAAGPLVLFQLKNGQNIAGALQAQLTSGDWEPYDYYPANTETIAWDFPLWISSYTFLDTPIALDPWALTGTTRPAGAPETINYNVCTNLWWLPAGSDAAIHNAHYDNFLEVHTQLFGTGRMQKFRSNFQLESGYSGGSYDLPKGGFFNMGEDGTAFPDLYEEYRLAPPDTNVPFPIMFPNGANSGDVPSNCTTGSGTVTSPCFDYQWHQYYADTDCIWVAFEYHQV